MNEMSESIACIQISISCKWNEATLKYLKVPIIVNGQKPDQIALPPSFFSFELMKTAIVAGVCVIL